MLTREEIKHLLHASRVVPLQTTDVHGPLGLEHLAREVAEIMRMPSPEAPTEARQVELPKTTWAKLAAVAEKSQQMQARPITAETVAAAIIEHALENGTST